MPPTVSQDTTQSLWDLTSGSPGHPGSGKIQLVEFSPFSSQSCPAKLPKPPRDHLVRPQNPGGQPSAWMPPTVSQDTTQSLCDPTLGSPGHPGWGKIQLAKFSTFSSQICLAKLPKTPRNDLVRTQSPSAGVPEGHQVLGCLLQCPKTPHNQYGTLPWGPLGTSGPAKSKKLRISPILGSSKKTRHKSKPPKTPKKSKKSKFHENEAVSSNICA